MKYWHLNVVLFRTWQAIAAMTNGNGKAGMVIYRAPLWRYTSSNLRLS